MERLIYGSENPPMNISIYQAKSEPFIRSHHLSEEYPCIEFNLGILNHSGEKKEVYPKTPQQTSGV